MLAITLLALLILQSSRVLRSNSAAPLTNRFIRNLDSTLSQEILDIPKTATEPMILPDNVTDCFLWESMCFTENWGKGFSQTSSLFNTCRAL